MLGAGAADRHQKESDSDEIAEKIKTSTSTVSKIGQIIKYGKGGLQKALGKKLKGGGKE